MKVEIFNIAGGCFTLSESFLYRDTEECGLSCDVKIIFITTSTNLICF